MAADKGFQAAESTHEVHYRSDVEDGDSLVFSTLLLNVPIWGHGTKFECASHICGMQ